MAARPNLLDFLQSVQSEDGRWYQVLQPLGVGRNATASLVMATGNDDLNKGLLFALKMFHRLERRDKAREFLREATFLTTSRHPAVMAVVDRGIYQGFPFFVADYLPVTLADVMRHDVSVLIKLSCAIQLLSALHYLEQLQHPVTHRDIKPDNIFIKGRSCVLGDFGLMILSPAPANTKQDSEPNMPHDYRTPNLVAFERGEAELTIKSDIFQLGLVLAELFTGHNPSVPADDKLAPVQLSDELDIDNRIPVAIRRPVKNLIAGMLGMDPAQRPSAGDLIDPWRGVFQKAAAQLHAIEGRAFALPLGS